MLHVTLNGLWAHKRRLASTFVAITLGVAFLSGTLVLGDTMRATFSDLFETGNRGTDAVVQAKGIDTDGSKQPRLIDLALVDRVAAVDGVAEAQPVIEGRGKLVGSNGKTIGGNGPPTLAGNWLGDSPINPYHLVEGRAPRQAHEVVVNRGAAKLGNLKVGDTTTVLTPEPVAVTIVGVTTFGTVDSAGGVTSTAFTQAAAQELLLHDPTKITGIALRARPGVSQTDLVARVQPLLPEGVTAKTQDQVTADQKAGINDGFLDFFTSFLLVFAGIALIVATFSIYNTFSIIVAQRAREGALLRAIGATRRQVLLSTVLEAAIVGAIASALGVIGGLGVAALLKTAFVAFGIDIPAAGLVLTRGTVLLAFAVGTGVTLTAGWVPARKAARVPPIAAIRDVAVEPTTAALPRVVLGLALAVTGTAVVVRAVLGTSGNVLAQAGLGSLVLMVGVVALGPVVAGTASRVLGWPLPRLRGVTGSLARENAIRNPRRTSGTAAALMVGVGVVTLFTVFASSATASVRQSVERSFAGDLVVTTGGFGGGVGGFSTHLASDIGAAPGVDTAVGLGNGGAKVDGQISPLTVGDPVAMARVLDLGVTSGSLATLGDHGIAAGTRYATERGWHVGTVVPVAFADGTSEPFTVGAIYEADDLLGNVVLPRAAWSAHAVQSSDVAVLVKLRPDVSIADARRSIEPIIAGSPGTELQDKDQYVQSVAAGVNQVLALVYVMLVLAIVIALMGIANTLSLSIHERTRELGLLRAVGQTRRQVKAMVRWESVIMALFGTVGGVGLGVFLGWALVKAAAGEGIGTFSAAPTQLAVVFAVGALAGVIAAVRPARRAARLDVLQAIATS